MELQRESVKDDISFMDFVLKYESEINKVQSMVSKSFETDVDELEKQIGDICSKMEFISWCFARSEELLTNACHKALIPKRKDITDLDRNMALEYSTSKERLLRDWLRNLDEKIMKYLDKAQSVLAVERAIIDKAGYGGKR